MSSKSQRYRAEIYAINAYLKRIEQKKFEELKASHEAGEFVFDSSISCSDDSDEERCQTSSDKTHRKNSDNRTSDIQAKTSLKHRAVKTAPNPLPKIGSFGGV